MLFNNTFDDSEAKAGAFGLARILGALADTVELVEDIGLVAGWDARTGIADGDSQLAGEPLGAEGNLATGGGEFDGVLDEVDQRLVQPVGVAGDGGGCRLGTGAS